MSGFCIYRSFGFCAHLGRFLSLTGLLAALVAETTASGPFFRGILRLSQWNILWLNSAMTISREKKLERRRERYLANREKILAKAAEYRFNNREKVRTAMKQWYAKSGAAYARQRYSRNPESILAAARKWKAKNPGYHSAKALEAYYQDIDAGRSRCRAYRAKDVERHRGRARSWSKQNPDKIRDKSRRYRARKIAATLEIFSETEIFDRDNWRCYICETEVRTDVLSYAPNRAVLDHVVALSRGGAHSRTNSRCACFPCNTMKGAHLTPNQVRERLASEHGQQTENHRPQIKAIVAADVDRRRRKES